MNKRQRTNLEEFIPIENIAYHTCPECGRGELKVMLEIPTYFIFSRNTGRQMGDIVKTFNIQSGTLYCGCGWEYECTNKEAFFKKKKRSWWHV